MKRNLFQTLDSAFGQMWSRKVPFFGVFFVVVLLTYAVLVMIDFIPEPLAETENAAITEVVNEDEEPARAVARTGTDRTPDRIIFDTLNKEVAILNPNTTSIEALDTALLSGVVRHPDSADLLDDGTMFLFGHSSYLPVVHNKNFQAFNGIQNLEWGDKIRIQSGDFEYVYRVDRTYETKATTAEVEIITGTPRLTLATCNTFGSKEDRYIVEATLIDSYPI